MRKFSYGSLGAAAGGALLWLACAAPALAAQTQMMRDPQVLFLIQFALILLTGRLFGEVAQRLGQPAVIGQLLAGVFLGPSVLGLLWPAAQTALFPAAGAQKSMIEAVSQLGILMLLLLTGMETDTRLVRRVGRAALSVSFTGIAAPFACGFALGQFLPDAMLPSAGHRLVTSLFLGTALSISSVKIVAMVVREMNFMRRDLGQVIVASAIIDDTIGWIIIAVTFAVAERGSVEPGPLIWSLAGIALFLGVSFAFGGRAVSALIRFVNDYFVSDMAVITAILLVMTGMALITQAIGVHTVLGAFVAGILVGQSPILTRHIDQQLRGLITALFMPVFFGLAGLGADLRILADPGTAALAALFIAVASIGKFLGAGTGGMLGGMTRAESLALAFAMNARGSTEVIVATIGLAMGALDQRLFTLIVAMAVITTMIMPPSLRWALARLPLGAQEKARLEREAAEASGFTANLDRFLVAADDGPSGRLASRIAGLLAGARQKPVTVIEIAAPQTGSLSAPGDVAVAAARKSESAAGPENSGPVATQVTTRKGGADAGDSVAAEAAKGFDLLVIGLEGAADADGSVSARAARAAAAYDGALALVIAPQTPRGAGSERLRILVAVTGNAASQRAAETAVALARAETAEVTGLYVSNAPAASGWGPSLRRALASDETAALKDFTGLADRYGVASRTVVRRDAGVAEVILRELATGRHSLLILGVSRRTGEGLFFGNVAKTLLARRPAAIMLLCDDRAVEHAGTRRVNGQAGVQSARA